MKNDNTVKETAEEDLNLLFEKHRENNNEAALSRIDYLLRIITEDQKSEKTRENIKSEKTEDAVWGQAAKIAQKQDYFESNTLLYLQRELAEISKQLNKHRSTSAIDRVIKDKMLETVHSMNACIRSNESRTIKVAKCQRIACDFVEKMQKLEKNFIPSERSKLALTACRFIGACTGAILLCWAMPFDQMYRSAAKSLHSGDSYATAFGQGMLGLLRGTLFCLSYGAKYGVDAINSTQFALEMKRDQAWANEVKSSGKKLFDQFDTAIKKEHWSLGDVDLPDPKEEGSLKKRMP